MADTKTAQRPTIRVSPEIHSRVEANRGKQSQGEYIADLFARIEELTAVADQKAALDLQLDTEKVLTPFKHLGGKKLDKNEHYRDLVDKTYTEQELVDTAIAVSGKSLEDLIKSALISQAKEEITRAKKREYDEKNGDEGTAQKLYKALGELTNEQAEGTYKPKFGRLNISGVAKRAGVEYRTAVKWAEANQPELLQTGRFID